MRTWWIFVLISLMVSSLASAGENWRRILSVEFQVGDFPQEGSPQYQRDFEILHAEQRNREPRECELAGEMSHPTFFELFSPIDDEVLSDRELRHVRPLMEKVLKLVERVTGYHKNKFLRPRPYMTDRKLKPCVNTRVFGRGLTSYPSSHASVSAASACVMAEIFPQREKEIVAYGDALGFLRVTVGVHHPSDVTAGQELGKTVCRRLLGSPEFLEELQAFR